MNKFYNLIIVASCILVLACTPQDIKVTKLQPMDGELSIYQGKYRANPIYITDTMGLVANPNIWESVRGYGKQVGDIKNCTKSTDTIIKVDVTQDNTAILVSEMRGDCVYYKKEFMIGRDIALLANGELVFITSVDGPHSMRPADAPTRKASWIIDQNHDLTAIQLRNIDTMDTASKKISDSRMVAIYERVK